MISRDLLTQIGIFRRTHALKGELNLDLSVDSDFITPETPLIVDIDGIPVPFYADSIRPKGAHTDLIKLHGVDSEEEASRFVNSPVYALRSELRKFMEETDEDGEDTGEGGYAEDFIGFTIIDEANGTVGEIISLDLRTSNALFVVETPDGEEVLIPVADEFIISIDSEKHTITMDLPEGLLD